MVHVDFLHISVRINPKFKNNLLSFSLRERGDVGKTEKWWGKEGREREGTKRERKGKERKREGEYVCLSLFSDSLVRGVPVSVTCYWTLKQNNHI